MTPTLFSSASYFITQTQFVCSSLFSFRYTQFLDVTGCDDDARSLFESVVGRL
jgi:hypothetical protein